MENVWYSIFMIGWWFLMLGLKFLVIVMNILFFLINYWWFIVSVVWYGVSWNLYCWMKKWCVCMVLNGVRCSVFIIILMFIGGGGVVRWVKLCLVFYVSNWIWLLCVLGKINGWCVSKFLVCSNKFVRFCWCCCCWLIDWKNLIIVVRCGVNVRSGWKILKVFGCSIIRCILKLCLLSMWIFFVRLSFYCWIWCRFG